MHNKLIENIVIQFLTKIREYKIFCILCDLVIASTLPIPLPIFVVCETARCDQMCISCNKQLCSYKHLWKPHK